MKSNTIQLTPYNPDWPTRFKMEACRIQKILGSRLKAIYHIGSTSIPDMPAKPVIDMVLVFATVNEMDFIAQQLAQLHYDPLRRQIIPQVSFFTKRQDDELSFHLHLHEQGSPQINRHVHFRDYVSQHPDVAQEYATLKMRLAAQSSDVYSYVSGKDKLVQEIDTKAKMWLGRRCDYLPANTGLRAKDWSNQQIVKAMDANLNVHMTHFAQYINQIELIRIPGFTLVNSGLADDTFNYVLDADFSSADADNKIAEIEDYFHRKNSPFSWWIGPHDKPYDLAQRLEHHGFKNTENHCAMYFDLDRWDGHISPLPELDIVRATDEKTLHDFALVLAKDKAAFKTYFTWIAAVLTDEDPIEYYVGYVDGKPVVRGLSCYFAQVAGLHWLSTVPSERRKGYGRAMQEYRLKRAKDLGYHIAVLQASSDGYPLYQKLGYKECGYFREWVKKGSGN